MKTRSVTQNWNNVYQSKTILNSVFTHTEKDKDFPNFLSLPLANDRTDTNFKVPVSIGSSYETSSMPYSVSDRATRPLFFSFSLNQVHAE